MYDHCRVAWLSPRSFAGLMGSKLLPLVCDRTVDAQQFSLCRYLRLQALRAPPECDALWSPPSWPIARCHHCPMLY